MNEREMKNRICHAIDNRLFGIRSDINFERTAIEHQEEAKAYFHKRSVLIIAVLLVILTFSALAAVLLWEEYAERAVENEQTTGRYSQWSIEEKSSLIEALYRMGYIVTEEKAEALFRHGLSVKEKHQLADSIVLDFLEQSPYIQQYETAFNGQIESVSSALLTFAVMGPEEMWPAEKRVWWQKLINPNVSSSNDLVLVNPKRDEIKEDEAIHIAISALTSTLRISEEELKRAQAVADMYVTDERPNYRRWLVTFNILAEGSNQYVERSYEVFIDGYGHLIADNDYGSEGLEERAARIEAEEGTISNHPIMEFYQEFAEFEESYLIREWSIDAKAAFSAMINEVQEGLKNVSHREIIAGSQCVYGLPDSESLPVDDARNLARYYIHNEYGLDQTTNADQYIYYEYYDVTNPDQPLWKFVFFPESFEYFTEVPVYKVILHAYSGSLLQTEKYDWRDVTGHNACHPVWY